MPGVVIRTLLGELNRSTLCEVELTCLASSSCRMIYRRIELMETPRQSRSASSETPVSKKRKKELSPNSARKRKLNANANENVAERGEHSDEEFSREAETSEISEYSRVRLRSSRNRWSTISHSSLFSEFISPDGLGISCPAIDSLDPVELVAFRFVGAQPLIVPGYSEEIGYYEVELIETQSQMCALTLNKGIIAICAN